MELGNRIKVYRQEAQLSQEELADRVYVSRQTISNWENDKCYPDVHSLILLSEIFHISLDKLIKGDIEVMKATVRKDEIEKWKWYQKVLAIVMITACLLTVPLRRWIGYWCFIPLAILMVVGGYFCFKMSRIEKDNDLQTFKEIVAFLDGREMEEKEKQQARAEANRTRIFRSILFLVAGLVTAFGICGLVDLLLELVKNVLD